MTTNWPLLFDEARSWQMKYGSIGSLDLRGIALQHADLRYADLQDVNLQHADLQHADLRYVNLQNADLRYADLEHASLHHASLQDANLQHASLRYVNLKRANLQGANLQYANLEYANFLHANLQSAIINWRSHALLGEILRNAAGLDAHKRMIAGLVLSSYDWCWERFAMELEGTPYVEWVYVTLARFIRPYDNHPEILDWYVRLDTE